MKAEDQFAKFDSATYLFTALAFFLNGEDATGLLPYPPWVIRSLWLPALKLANGILPDRIRSHLARRAGVAEAMQPEDLNKINGEEIAAYITAQYPARRMPAVAVGSSNGALVHLAAALGIAWLPQTLLSLIRRDMPPDELVHDFDFGRNCAPHFLENNPGIALHQMNDPGNDRLMAQKMAYFRWKYRRLPQAYQHYIVNNLAPDGQLWTIECTHERHVTRINDRHVYQVGGYGGLTWEEYSQGGPRVRDFLERYKSPHDHFIIPQPTHETIEAEWGFDAALLEPLTELASQRGYTLRRMIFDDPEVFSPLVADLYRWWYARMGRPTNRLVVEPFTAVEPGLVLRGGLIPFWIVFNGENSLAALRDYLDQRPGVTEVLLSLFSNTVESVGIPPVETWVKELSTPQRRVTLIATDPTAYPIDLASMFRFYFDLDRATPRKLPLPPPLTLNELDLFLSEYPRSGVRFEE